MPYGTARREPSDGGQYLQVSTASASQGGHVPAKLLSAFVHKADESKTWLISIETAILLFLQSQTDMPKFLSEAAQVYKVTPP